MAAPEIRELKFSDMVFNRRGGPVRRLIHAVTSISLRLFFRRIETINVSEVPYNGPLIFVMNHPNGLVDPALVFVALPRKVSFLAKSTLFRIPVLSNLLAKVEALPVYRKIDEADVEQNKVTFEASHFLLKKGGAIALFPEGVSHNSPKLLPIKTGAARIALGAISGFSAEADIDLRIIPVGLFYTSKTRFRSEVLLFFGRPIEVEAEVPGEDGDPPREAVRDLTNKIEAALREVTVNAESGADIESANEAANLFLSVSETMDLEEPLAARFEFVKEFLSGYGPDEDVPAATSEITGMISDYKRKLREIGLEPENLSLSRHPYWYVFQHFILRVLLIALFLPFMLIGTLLHLPAYELTRYLGSRYSKHGVDDIVSTVKIIAGLLLMPLTWLIAGGAAGYFFDWKAGLVVIPLAAFCGFVAMRSLEALSDLRGWFRAVLLFFRKREVFVELLLERRKLHRRLRKLG